MNADCDVVSISIEELGCWSGPSNCHNFDMALYEKAVQLLDARPNLKSKIVPRLGELHAMMAALRALGTSIENSGIDDAWIEADVYRPATTRQILKCSHYNRVLRAHTHT